MKRFEAQLGHETWYDAEFDCKRRDDWLICALSALKTIKPPYSCELGTSGSMHRLVRGCCIQAKVYYDEQPLNKCY